MSGSTRSRSSCSTRPTACSTWASSTTCARSSRCCRRERQTLLFSATMPAPIAKLAQDILDRSGSRRHRSGKGRGRPHRPARVLRRRQGEAGAARKPARRSRHGPRAGLHPHQARRRPRLPQSYPGRHRRRRPARQQGAERARARAGSFPQRQACASSSPPTSPRAASTSPNISHVINYELPNEPESYVHRIGRTARAGAEGAALVVLRSDRAASYLQAIERLMRSNVSRRRASACRHAGHGADAA